MSRQPSAGRQARKRPPCCGRLLAVAAILGIGTCGALHAHDTRGAAQGVLAQGEPSSATRDDRAAPRQPLEAIIARVVVNSVSKGDSTIFRSADGAWLAPVDEVANWGLQAPAPARIVIGGAQYVALERLPGLDVRFDERIVTLELRARPDLLYAADIDLRWKRQPGTVFPADKSLLFNYNVTAFGDESFGSLTYQGTTEFAARTGNWLLYNTTTYQDGDGISGRMTRLLTNLQHDDRTTLQRLTLGDFFTPGFDLSGSVGMGGISFAKLYRMDPYFVQYPTAGFTTEIALPSTVEVRIDGNLVAQRQVAPGPLDVRNVTAAAGQRNVSVIVRDPFGREQVIAQPFYFTQFGLAKGLHEYSYNLGALRLRYGVASNDYGPVAASAYHRYAFTDSLTLGLRGEASNELVNFGPFATIQLPRTGILGLGVSGSERNGAQGHAASVSYSYARENFNLGFAGRYFSRDFAQLADDINPTHLRSDAFANAALSFPWLGTLSAGYSATRSYEFPTTRSWNLGYTQPLFDARAILTVNYTHYERPTASHSWLLSLTYYFDRENSAVARVGGGPDSNFQTATLQKVVPNGEGYGYLAEAGRLERSGATAAVGRGLFQLNGAHGIVGVEASTSTDRRVLTGTSRAFVAGGIGYAGGTAFFSRPIIDSFAVVKVGDVPGVPVYANGWLQGRSDERGVVVATDLNAFYDNDIAFRAQDLPLNYQYPKSHQIISPPNRSGSLVQFQVNAFQAVYGQLILEQDGRRTPLQVRELKVSRGERTFDAFTARRGEFYFENLEPGEYTVRARGEPVCTAVIHVRKSDEPFVDLGPVLCRASAG